jgi:hypothetical protein
VDAQTVGIVGIFDEINQEFEEGYKNLEWWFLMNFNQIADDAGINKIYDVSGKANHIPITNYTPNQVSPTNKEYQLIPIETIRENEIQHSFTGDTVNPMSEQVNLLDSTTAPTDTYIFEGALPSGLGLSVSGALTGTATQIGTFQLLIRNVDASGNFEYKRVQIVIF